MNLVNLKFEDIRYEECECNVSSTIEAFEAKMDMKDCSFGKVEFFSSLF
jgi:hypothetical protein